MQLLGRTFFGQAAEANDRRLHFVEDGRVLCPKAGDVDIEQCFECTAFLSAGLGGPTPSMRCKGIPASPGLEQVASLA